MKSICIILLLLSPPLASAQDSGLPRRSPTNEEEVGRNGRGQDWNLPPDIRARLAIERANNEHRKVLEDVEKMSELTVDVTRHYDAQGQLSADDLKNLEKIEKFAKRVLSFAGGSEEDDDSLKELSLKEMIARLFAAVEKVKTTMSKDPRQVVSAVVIGKSNEAITLTQQIRRIYRK